MYSDLSNKTRTKVKGAYFSKLIIFSKPEVRDLLVQYLWLLTSKNSISDQENMLEVSLNTSWFLGEVNMMSFSLSIKVINALSENNSVLKIVSGTAVIENKIMWNLISLVCQLCFYIYRTIYFFLSQFKVNYFGVHYIGTSLFFTLLISPKTKTNNSLGGWSLHFKVVVENRK